MVTDPIQSILVEYPLLILDGALATELERRGCDLSDPLWSAKVLLEEPELIRQLHFDYFAAGADCAITASYQATVEGFARRGLSEGEALRLIRRSVELAREAREQFLSAEGRREARPRPLVAASVGPYGAFLADGSEYRGDYAVSTGRLERFHRGRMHALVDAGPDIIACETIPCLREAVALADLLEEHPGIYAWMSFTARDGSHLRSGESFADAVAAVADSNRVAAVGVNCTSPEYLPELITAAREVTEKPVVVYPNSGESYDPVRGRWSGVPACRVSGASAREWYRCGARLIGGCCRTSPEDIRSIAAWARGELFDGEKRN